MNRFLSQVNAFVFGLLLSVSALGYQYQPQQATPLWLMQLQPIPDAVLVTTPDHGNKPVVQAFQSARKSIWIEIYHLTDVQALNALIQARGRGVDVQIIYDGNSLKQPKYKQVYEQLTNAGISVYPSSSQFTITHAKTFLIDGQLLFISTMNITNHYGEMRDLGIFTRDTALVAQWLAIFQTDLQNSKAQTMNTPNITHANFVVSPVNSEVKILDLISMAQTNILLTVENLGSREVIAALQTALARGVKVYTITPECDFGFDPLYNYPALYTLQKSGAENRVMPAPSSPRTPYIHAKYIVVDGRLSFLGSENFSYNSLRKAREMGLVMADSKIATQLSSIFNADWQNSKPLPRTPPNNCAAINGGE